MANLKTKEYYLEIFKKVHCDKYNYDESIFINSKIKIKIYCKFCNCYFEQPPYRHKKYGCQKCGFKLISSTREEFIKESIEKHGNLYGYEQVEYINNATKVKIFCNKCNEYFWLRPVTHISTKARGCQKCGENNRRKNKKRTTDDFIEESIKIHGDKYKYDRSKFININTIVEIFCNQCNSYFNQTPKNHLRGSNCPKCVFINQTKSKEKFIEEASIIHNNIYEYNKSIYVTNKTKLKILCKMCNKYFEQTPNAHITCGHGCPYCAGFHITTDEFINRAKNTHNNKYEYNETIFVNYKTKIKIFCKKCSRYFEQFPGNHVKGDGCSFCSRMVSNSETLWLNSLEIPDDVGHRQITIKIKKSNGKTRTVRVDGFDPSSNTIYEFNGDYWHGNPKIFDKDKLHPVVKKTFGELYQRTIKKEQELKNMGYTVISIWESDWKKGNKND